MPCCALLACLIAQPLALFAAFRAGTWRRRLAPGTCHVRPASVGRTLSRTIFLAEIAFLAAVCAAVTFTVVRPPEAQRYAHYCRFATEIGEPRTLISKALDSDQ